MRKIVSESFVKLQVIIDGFASRKEKELARHKKEMDKIVSDEQYLKEKIHQICPPEIHDCTKGGTRRIFHTKGVIGAIFEVLPSDPAKAMQVGELHKTMKNRPEPGFSYAYVTVAISLGNKFDDAVATDIFGNKWNMSVANDKWRGEGPWRYYKKKCN